MNLARSIPSKTNGTLTAMPPLPTVSKSSTRLQTTRSSIVPSSTKKERTIGLNPNNISLSSQPNRDELEAIVTNLSTIVKKSEQLLTPVKPTLVSTNIRRTASLHLTKMDLDRRKLPNPMAKQINARPPMSEKVDDQRTKLHESISDRSSECSTSASSITGRRTIRPVHNTEKYVGIKCTLPAFTTTIPHTFKGLTKHCTPTKPQLTNSTASLMENQLTPAKSNGREKSPWRLRFEKFLNHEQPTPLSPARETVAFTQEKTSSFGKENRTPSFRLPARRMSRCPLPS